MASKDTDLAEASQALFCALIDYVGVNKMDEIIDEMFSEKSTTKRILQ